MTHLCRILIALTLVAGLSGCMAAIAPPPGERDPEDGVFNAERLEPRAGGPYSGKQVRTNLAVVMQAPVEETVVLRRSGGKVTIHYVNFRSALDQALRDTFKPNFQSVTSAAAPTNKGLELIVTHIQDNPADNGFDWKATFAESGQPVANLYGTMLPNQTIQMQSTIYTWKRDTKNAITQITNGQLAGLGEYIAKTLLLNDGLNPLWAKYQ